MELSTCEKSQPSDTEQTVQTLYAKQKIYDFAINDIVVPLRFSAPSASPRFIFGPLRHPGNPIYFNVTGNLR
jgi:hypothetical protein